MEILISVEKYFLQEIIHTTFETSPSSSVAWNSIIATLSPCITIYKSVLFLPETCSLLHWASQSGVQYLCCRHLTLWAHAHSHCKCIGDVLHPISVLKQGFILRCIQAVLSFQKRSCCIGLCFLFSKYQTDYTQHRKRKKKERNNQLLRKRILIKVWSKQNKFKKPE